MGYPLVRFVPLMFCNRRKDTRGYKHMTEKLMRKMKFYKLLGHESYGGSGGLIMMWKKEITIQAKWWKGFY
jgi:hypothetical protein